MTKARETSSGPILRGKLTNLLLFFCSALVSLILAEFALRWAAPHEYYMSLIPTDKREVTNLYTSIYTEADSISYQSVNQWGYRSPSQFGENRFGIMAIGGSTTYCNGLSDEDTWPWILETSLNSQANGMPFTVGNVGVSAFDSYHNSLQLEHLQPQFDNVNMVIMLMGINDYTLSLYLADDFTGMSQHPQALNRTFIRFPRLAGKNWYQRTELWMHLRDLRNRIKIARKPKSTLEAHFNKINRYLEAKKIDTLPDISKGLLDYENNLRRIAQLARERNIKLVWLTQPTLYTKDIPAKNELLVAAFTPSWDEVAYSQRVTAEGMQVYNELMVKVANEENVILIDLEAAIPKTTKFMMDFSHYTKHGSEAVAEIVYNQLKPYLPSENTFSN